jgi:hypothetical protein
MAYKFFGAAGAIGATGARRFSVFLIIRCAYQIIHSNAAAKPVEFYNSERLMQPLKYQTPEAIYQ